MIIEKITLAIGINTKDEHIFFWR